MAIELHFHPGFAPGLAALALQWQLLPAPPGLTCTICAATHSRCMRRHRHPLHAPPPAPSGAGFSSITLYALIVVVGCIVTRSWEVSGVWEGAHTITNPT